MKILIVLSLLFSFVSCNLFAQSSASISDSSLSTNTLNNSFKSLTKDSIEQTSDKDSGMLIGAVVGGCSGVLASSSSLEPHSENKISFPAVLVGGVAGAFVGAIIGGIASEK